MPQTPCPIYNSRRIWLIGGTSESALIAEALAHETELSCIITVTTEAAKKLYPKNPLLEVWVGKLDIENIGKFLQEQQIAAILDASHPHAAEISKLAIATAAQYQIPYLRYERPPAIPPSPNPGKTNENIIQIDSFETLVAGDFLTQQRVLLTIGYRFLSLFRPWQEKATLFARILPSLTALEAALNAGFTSDRLIAIRPPISIELERALWQQWQISMVVTKASGKAGGEDIKRVLAAELGKSLIIIKRPPVKYPKQTSNIADVLEFLKGPCISNFLR
ncbi:MAG: cobalt-precorrin-6A reductase [Oscillatoriaceae bacterium SKYG93]|nr:cobalt-precorrin-6A reductase [Oscillatoriaceae bacterium SKYG93]MDW8452243.1 cobalt-precorrin-6A reductase [Oscillatoriaceae cyanobacterium SKYGB_i_bin93]